MGNPISGHGTLIAIELDPVGAPGVYTTVAELSGDIMVPDLTRKEIDVSAHNRDIDSYVLGMLRRSSMTFPITYVASDSTHDNLTGLYSKIRLNQTFGTRVTFPDADVWISSGGISAIKKKAPIDDKLAADVTFRPSGAFSINGMVIGG